MKTKSYSAQKKARRRKFSKKSSGFRGLKIILKRLKIKLNH